MEFIAVMGEIFKFFEIPMSVYGFEIRFIDLMMWSAFVGLIAWVLEVLFYE